MLRFDLVLNSNLTLNETSAKTHLTIFICLNSLENWHLGQGCHMKTNEQTSTKGLEVLQSLML